MADRSAIEWTDATWNPIVGCSRVSAGCQHCYAERHAYRFAQQPGSVFEGTARLVNGKPTFTGRVNFNARVLDHPLRWRAPRRIFVNSMSDLFHENVQFNVIAAVFGIMAAAPQHTFQILTKRPENALRWFEWMRDSTEAKLHECVKGALGYHHPKRPAINNVIWPLQNVWLGVSVEDQAAADERIPLLLRTPAAVRFLSCEPLLGTVNLRHIQFRGKRGGMEDWDALDAHGASEDSDSCDAVIDWVIAGGESGHDARPMHPDWARSLRDQCAAARVPFFFKQWGEWAPGECCGAPPTRTERVATLFPDGWELRYLTPAQSADTSCDDEPDLYRIGKKKAGHLLDGVEHHAFPEVPA